MLNAARAKSILSHWNFLVQLTRDPSFLLFQVEKDYSDLKEVCDRQAEQLSRTSLKLQEKASESDAEIKDMKETIFELEDQVEQHRAVKLQNNQLISELESK